MNTTLVSEPGFLVMILDFDPFPTISGSEWHNKIKLDIFKNWIKGLIFQTHNPDFWSTGQAQKAIDDFFWGAFFAQ